jgi:nicotinate-nucleotide adenylyltransferase
MWKVGLFGGSFNPPHFGHVHISKVALQKFNLSKLYWLVVPENPDKKNIAKLTLKKRISLSQNLIGKNSKMQAIDFESNLKTFETCNTIKKALHAFQKSKLFWIMGTDNLFHFYKWRRANFIAKNINFLLFPRGNFHKSLRTASFIKYKNKMHFIYTKKCNISSTEIREKFGSNWREML